MKNDYVKVKEGGLESSALSFHLSSHMSPQCAKCDENNDNSSNDNSSSSNTNNNNNNNNNKRPHFPFVILGGGTTAYSAIEAIRQVSPKSHILVISRESVLPNLHRGDVYHNNDEGRVEIGDDFLSSYNEWRRHITSKLASEPDAYNVREDDDDMEGGRKGDKGGVSLLLRQKDIKIDKDNKLLSLDKGGRSSSTSSSLRQREDPRASTF